MRRIAAILLILISLCICSLVYAESAAVNETFKIGVILDLTGDLGMQNQAFREGIELAVDLANKKGGVAGKQISTVYEDSNYSPSQSVTAAKRLINVDHIVGAINSSAIQSKANASVFERAKIPVITLWDANPELDQLGKYLFSIGLWTPSSGETAANFALTDLKAKTAVIFSMDDSWSLLVAKAFTQRFSDAGGKVLSSMSFAPTETDFRSAISKATSHHPDVIYAPLTVNFIAFFKQMRDQKIHIPVVTSDLITDAHLNEAGEVLEGVTQTMLAANDNPQSKIMLQMYLEHYGHPSTQPEYVAWGFDGANLLIEALRLSQAKKTNMTDELRGINKYAGATGELSFAGKQSSPQYPKVFKIAHGKFEGPL
jgi:branched-chain amino acid transport system substrate-binding protein